MGAKIKQIQSPVHVHPLTSVTIIKYRIYHTIIICPYNSFLIMPWNSSAISVSNLCVTSLYSLLSEYHVLHLRTNHNMPSESDGTNWPRDRKSERASTHGTGHAICKSDCRPVSPCWNILEDLFFFSTATLLAQRHPEGSDSPAFYCPHSVCSRKSEHHQTNLLSGRKR